jgi:capsular polysaccharide biosynthesis protein
MSLIACAFAEVVAVIGPHGGAFYNTFFCARGTLVIEFFPLKPSGTSAYHSESDPALNYRASVAVSS